MNDQSKTHIKTISKKKIKFLCGTVFLIISFFILISIFTFDSQDAGWGVSSTHNIKNFFGYPGSYISGLILKEFGIYSGLIVFATFLFLGLKLLGNHEFSFILTKFFGFISLVFLSGLISPGINIIIKNLIISDHKFFSQIGLSHHIYEKTIKYLIDKFNFNEFNIEILLNIIIVLISLMLFVWIVSFNNKDLRLINNFVRPLYLPFYWLLLLTNNLLFKKSENIVLEDIKDETEKFKFKNLLKNIFFKNNRRRKNYVKKEPVLIKLNDNDEYISNSKKVKISQRKLNLPSESGFHLPSVDLLQGKLEENKPPDKETLDANARLLEGVLNDFSINGNIEMVRYGPVVTRYDLEPAPGLRSQRVISLADDIARSMAVDSVRVAMVPGQNVIGIELPNKIREKVVLRTILENEEFQNSKLKLPVCLGKNIAGSAVVVDLSLMPHLLVAGTTGSGKSVGVNAMILSLLYKHTPETCRFIMIDPKMLELSVYDGIPHLLTPVVTDPNKAITALKWAVREMESRYLAMSKIGVRNIESYNERLVKARLKGEVITRNIQVGFDTETGQPVFEEQEIDLNPLPFIIVVIDEVADLMLVAGKDIEAAVQRLAQMARAAGIHVIMATQRPSVDVITGTIKANFPTRISFQVTSKIDSRTILGEQGGEQLLGKGDMLYMAGGGKITRVHGPFVDDIEVEQVSKFLSNQLQPNYDESITEEPQEHENLQNINIGENNKYNDEIYDKAVKLVIQEQKASTSFIQRHFRIGYNRAATIIEKMEENNVISKPGRAGKREILTEEK